MKNLLYIFDYLYLFKSIVWLYSIQQIIFETDVASLSEFFYSNSFTISDAFTVKPAQTETIWHGYDMEIEMRSYECKWKKYITC